MTAQHPDGVFYEDHWYAVTAVDGAGLFDPTAHGLEPQGFSTGCYRGYICRYAVVAQRLVLRDLELGSDGEPPPLGDVLPRQSDECPTWRYRGLDIAVAFTGRLLIGDGDIADGPYLNMGFWPAWMFEQVHELTLRSGSVLTAEDCSAALDAQRADIMAVAARPAPGESRLDWITRTFSLTYGYSWPDRP